MSTGLLVRFMFFGFMRARRCHLRASGAMSAPGGTGADLPRVPCLWFRSAGWNLRRSDINSVKKLALHVHLFYRPAFIASY